MKRILTFILLLGSTAAFADVTIDSVTVKPSDAFGLDKVYDFKLPALTPSPKGYEPVLIEHYGRHGSRYAYSGSYYKSLKKVLDIAEAKGLLTAFGKDLSARYAVNYDDYLLRTGDLTSIGWEQHRKIACLMYENFPAVFSEGARVTASASESYRSIMSMSSFCLGLQSMDGSLKIAEHTGHVWLNGTCPRDKHNPVPSTRAPRQLRLTEPLDDFQDRKLDCDSILSKLFTDVDAVCRGIDKRDLVRRMYVLVSGMQSLQEEVRTDFTGLFTEEEFARMWLVDNYKRFLEYYVYLPACSAVVDDIIADADKRLGNADKGATLRFGHDHVMMPVFEAMGIYGYESDPATPDEVARTFRSWDSPMATNIQLVFYRSASADTILFKLLRNGREVPLAIKPVSFPYYDWAVFKSWFLHDSGPAKL